MAVAALAGLYSLGAEWRHSTQLAASKGAATEKVLAPKCDGSVEESTLSNAADYRLADGMVFERLSRVTKCMRGLEPDARKVRECWRDITPMFRGAAAERFGRDSVAALGRTGSELQQRIANGEHVTVEMSTGRRKTVEGGYGVSWREFGKRGGKQVDAPWSAVYTVQLVPITEESGGLVITDYTWEEDSK